MEHDLLGGETLLMNRDLDELDRRGERLVETIREHCEREGLSDPFDGLAVTMNATARVMIGMCHVLDVDPSEMLAAFSNDVKKGWRKMKIKRMLRGSEN